MNARAWILSASLLLGCLPAAEPFRCDLAGGDRACDSVPGARCVAGYCAESVSISLCASGLRYTASALRAGECAAVDDAAVVDVTDAVVDVTAPPDLVAAVDAHDVSSSQDLPSPMDLAAADLPTPTDTSDVIDASDVVTAMDASDVVTAMDASDVVTAMDVRDVVTAMDVRDVPDVPDAIDAVALRDAPDVIDVVTARDVTDVVDAPDVPVVPPPPVEWLSPLPNERFLSGRVPVRIVRRGNDIINVRTALGLNCDRAQTLTSLAGVSVDISTNRNYLCLRLEVGADGGVWISPWRRIVSMGRNYAQNAAAHWGRWPDFNNDGQADLLMATETAVRVLRFPSANTMESGATVPGPTTSARPVAVAAVGDVDGDGFGDAVITWNLNPGRAVHLHRGGSMGLQGPGPSLPGPPNTDLTLGERIFPIGDREGDGRANFGVWAESHNRVRTFGMDAQGRFVEGLTYSAPAPLDVFVSDADVDGDELPDSAFTAGGQTYLSLSGQRDNIILPVQGMDDGAFGRRLAFGSDLNNDGRSEFAVLVPSLGQAVIYQWVNAQLRELTRVDVTPTQPAQLVMPGDVGSDLADDLYAFTGPNRVRLRQGNSTSDSETSLVWTEPLGVILAGVADSDTSGRVWGPGSTAAPNGFVIYNFSGNMTVPFPVANVLTGPVIAVSP